ncbi:hypothetical protein EC973_002429 [Apophysomyces ossiformis]|uniref:Gag1-like clamp domain-containing protein n=1 Tax=Apophysomyces ossiformis TaxID=679940 RepID=A0A8H7EMJ9_9FUNG|nr:hypothetical protein EC973_002429 [Apophysomyces ossiformis]
MESVSSSANEIPKYGLEAWLARRKAWTKKPETASAPSNGSSTCAMSREWLESSSKETQLALFKALVIDRRKLNQPLPLEFAVKIMIQGWQSDGTWPEGMVAPQSSDENQ